MTISWNKNLNAKTRVIFFIVNLGIFILSIIGINYWSEIDDLALKYTIISISSILNPFSFLFMLSILDWKNKKVKVILYIILGIILGALSMLLIYNNNIRIATLVFMVSMGAFIIYKIFENVFVTIFSFLFFVSMSFLLILKFLIFITPHVPKMSQINGFLWVYISTVVSLILYKVIALKLNQFLLKFFGNKEAHDLYDEKHLKNLLNVMYLFAFIIINICYYSVLIDDIWFNYINNTFLTLLAIINVDWENILLLHKKVKSNETQV